MLALCASVRAQRKGARKVRKGHGTWRFHTSWKELQSTWILHRKAGDGKEEESLVKFYVISCINMYKKH